MKSWLIQRGCFKNIKKKDIVGIDSLVSFDYMGSAEFEFGALPESLKEICKNLSDYKKFPTPYKKGEETLYIICTDIVSAKENLDEVISGKQLKERSYLDVLFGNADSVFAPKDIRNDFWWDLGNHWMCVIGKEKAKKTMIALEKVKEKRGW